MRPAILVVDDEKIIRFFLEKALYEKYDVVVKENGQEALKWLQQGNKPDLVITDLYMPEMNGYELLKQIRSGKETANIIVIMLTGMECADEKKKCLELGANDYLSKPLNITQLINKIEALLIPKD